MTCVFSQAESEDRQVHPKLGKYKQRRREVQCAVNLVEKLQLYVEGKTEEFEAAARAEALELSQSPLGGKCGVMYRYCVWRG